MCPNCVTSGTWVWLGPGLICLGFGVIAWFFLHQAKESGAFEGDEEDPKYAVFDD